MSQSIYRQVVVGTDGSATATRAVRSAITVAAALRVPLVVATAWYREMKDEPPPSVLARIPGGSLAGHEARWAEETAVDAAALARGAGVPDVRQVTPVGGAAETLIAISEDQPGSLVVVGTRGLSSRTERLVGNVPHQLTHHATSDVLLVATEDDHDPGWKRIALATDGSPTAAVACQHGVALATALGVDPVLLTVAASESAGTETLERAQRQLETRLTQQVVLGDVGQGLVAAGRDVDLLVIGNKGMSGPSRLLGSVSNAVTHAVPTDLLLVNTTR